ncbi:MAG: hypothetical protein CMF62_12105 [Magnetococcales bacterium]|nr:hypothetical protein [Magnetococcales bacterium]|tara:strand:- start:209517 stop:210200 length:684 start_codon:yes stop_codon:yes gene_type:complete
MSSKATTKSSPKIPVLPAELVLLPGTQIMLRMKDEQYKKMVDDCIRDEMPFGVMFCSDADHPLATISMVGCLANILDFEAEDDGTYVTRVEGGERFMAKAISKADEGYFLAEYTHLPEDVDIALDENLFDSILNLLEIYFELLEMIDPELVEELPNDLSRYDLTFLALDHMAVGDSVRQEGLEMPSVKERGRFCIKILRQEIERLKFLLSASDDEDEDEFEMPQRMN